MCHDLRKVTSLRKGFIEELAHVIHMKPQPHTVAKELSFRSGSSSIVSSDPCS